jgi:hypothetical protein
VADLLAGDVGLSRSVGAVGAIIRFGARVRYAGWWAALAWLAKKIVGIAPPDLPEDPWYVNHAWVCVGGGQLIEALAHGLTLTPVAAYTSDEVVVIPLLALRSDVSDADRAHVVAFARTQLARHDAYGWLSIASIVVEILTPSKLDVSWDGALICSAFAGQCLEHAGLTLPTRSSLTTMPADLAAMAHPIGGIA